MVKDFWWEAWARHGGFRLSDNASGLARNPAFIALGLFLRVICSHQVPFPSSHRGYADVRILS